MSSRKYIPYATRQQQLIISTAVLEKELNFKVPYKFLNIFKNNFQQVSDRGGGGVCQILSKG